MADKHTKRGSKPKDTKSLPEVPSKRGIAAYASMSEDEQFEAVAWGDKPMCSISKKHGTNLPCISFISTTTLLTDGVPVSGYNSVEYLYYKFGLSDKAKRAAYLLPKHKTPAEHRELGLLLGYTAQEVDAWCNDLVAAVVEANSGLLKPAPKSPKPHHHKEG